MASFPPRRALRSLLSAGRANLPNTPARNADRAIVKGLLSILYVKRRQNIRDPGIGDLELERLLGCPAEHLEFHLWYLKEKSWIGRTENGMFAITVEGVDRANSEQDRKTVSKKLLSNQSHTE